MARIKIPQARATIADLPAGPMITIPAQKNWYLILFGMVWMAGWLFGEVSVIRQLTTRKWPGYGDLFSLVWLAGWTVGGCVMAYMWLWTVTGKEMVFIGNGVLAIKRDILGLGPLHEYQLVSVKDLRFAPAPVTLNNQWRWFSQQGTIAFDYGAKTIRFGSALDEAEARDIIRRMESYHQFGSAAGSH